MSLVTINLIRNSFVNNYFEDQSDELFIRYRDDSIQIGVVFTELLGQRLQMNANLNKVIEIHSLLVFNQKGFVELFGEPVAKCGERSVQLNLIDVTRFVGIK